MTRLRFSVDLDEWFDLLDAHEGPGEATVLALDAVLAEGFADTQAMTHIITGSLKASGRMVSRAEREEWSGEITYGGPAPGAVNDPVRYAVYEFQRGGDHNALRNVHLLGEEFIEALFTDVRAEKG